MNVKLWWGIALAAVLLILASSHLGPPWRTTKTVIEFAARGGRSDEITPVSDRPPSDTPGPQSGKQLSPDRPIVPLASPPSSDRSWRKQGWKGYWREVEDRGKEDFEATLGWARGLESIEARDRALSVLSFCLCGIIPERIDVSGAIVLASEIRDPALRLSAQGQIAVYWAGLQPEQALAWAQFLPVNVPSGVPPKDEEERITWNDYDSREKILAVAIQRWTAPSYEEDIRVYPQAKCDAARRWINQASLTLETKRKLLTMIPKPR
jgi:hypothetical protein